MNNFNSVIMEALSTIGQQPRLPENSVNLPTLKTPSSKPSNAKYGENNGAVISGKYGKKLGDVESRVADVDKKKGEQANQIKAQQSVSGNSMVLSKSQFDKFFNDSGERSIEDFEDGREYVINSKDKEFTATRLSDGRIKIKRSR